ncbi:MAG: VCBS repeat-containing protein [Chitinophagaceae bacterium]|nr:VCBS repeat-containing protein [Chitinophagaceae bacterium]
MFSRLDKNETGIDFRNLLVEDESLNISRYAYFYNGGGVAVGDINNDGLQDILFTGNMVKNRLYINKGNFEFENITDKSRIAEKQGWCTGAVMTDINGDGYTDIYICRSADGIASRRKNLLFINNGDLTFTEKAEAFGLDNDGYSTQAAFFDYDKDGDLDMFLINHSLRQYATGAIDNPAWRNEHNAAFECKLYRNDFNETLKHPVYTDVSDQAGIISNVLSFGLGLAVSDINNDGWPDVYVSNDFNEPDYLFINNGNGTFSEKLSEYLDYSSLYSMGSDISDFDNDGLVDIVTMDMLPESNYAQKMHQGAENFDKFRQLFKNGFSHQYSRNMLQKNNGNGTFSEIGQLAGIANTDWSWAALLADFDNDGKKDLLTTAGFVRDHTDMDFLRYSVDLSLQQRRGEKIDLMKDYIEKMPPNQLVSAIFKNNGNDRFTRVNDDWGLTHKTIATGAAYADLDNDGNLDIIISNINDIAGIYRNNGSDTGKNNYLKIKLKGDTKNPDGIGGKIKLFCGGERFYQEQFPSRGYQSSVDVVLHFGIGAHAAIDSVLVIWPDDTFQVIKNVLPNQLLTLNKQDAVQNWQYAPPLPASYFFRSDAIAFRHRENEFSDFTVQPLLPHYLSRQGPCIAKCDVNGDGTEDLFIGGAKGQAGQIFLQNKAGKFAPLSVPALLSDSASEDVSALFFDANGDGYPDLYVGSGGYEFAASDKRLQDRLYINDGKGSFSSRPDALPQMLISTGCVKAADIDGDGDLDLFAGGRVIPGKYPDAPESKILLNDGKGKFSDATEQVAPALKRPGMVTDAVWIDLNRDGKQDLIVVGEWMPVMVFINTGGKLEDRSSKYITFPSTGWWNKILADDFDNDGDMDIVLGNLGANTQFKANEKEPVSIYYDDFDGNGTLDPVFCYYINGISYPAAARDDLMEQLPALKSKFTDYASYANATINEIFSPEQLKGTRVLEARLLQSVFLRNEGEAGFTLNYLPKEAQYAPVYAMASLDINNDGKKDIILSGNNSWTRIKFGSYRANHGIVLTGDGNGNFSYMPQPLSGLNMRYDIRSMEMLNTPQGTVLVTGANDDSVKTYLLRR